MKKQNEQFEKNIASLIKSTDEQQIPSGNFTNTLIDEALKEPPNNQDRRQERNLSMESQHKKLIGIAASIIVIVSVGVLLKRATEQPAQNINNESNGAVTENNWIPIQIELPSPLFIGTPESLAGITNLEPDTKRPRSPFLAPADVKNLAMNKSVTSSEMDPINGTLDMIVDGDKEATEGSVVELGPFEQWVVIDLEQEYELYAIVFWHYHKQPRVYKDVVLQLSNDPEFITDVITLFNNDMDNSLDMGIGPDKHYIDKHEGKLVDAKGTRARYVKLWSQSNNQNDYSHYIEAEVWGRHAQ